MKKILVAIALAAVASTASATIAGSKHDFTTAGSGSVRYPTLTAPGTCQFCHAPHVWKVSNIGTAAPLWNRNVLTLTGYTVYTTTVLGNNPTQPNARSLTCLSCHDGRTSVGALNNWGGAALPNAIPGPGYLNGTDLRNDHPVSIAYPTNAEYKVGPLFGTWSPIINGNIECASCHDPHTIVNSFFLRAAPSAVCGTCHLK